MKRRPAERRQVDASLRRSANSAAPPPAGASWAALRPPVGQRLKDRPRPMAGEGGGDVRADLEAPVRALPVRSGQVGRDRLADEIVELGVGEDRARAADQRMDRAGDRVGKRRILARRRDE